METKFVREVGKLEQKLWENVWLKRRGRKGRGEAISSFRESFPCFNCHEPEESDCLIKTKRSDGFRKLITERDFCPVLTISQYRNISKNW